ncbi:hypothetical protein HMPREF9120_00223 [Neisseria sp. oral taxon 020 str. F0370]|nr:hypothetical protein HMPREF9120_00223 [Neisseria sp. oral taxon 020 str. F0370]
MAGATGSLKAPTPPFGLKETLILSVEFTKNHTSAKMRPFLPRRRQDRFK